MTYPEPSPALAKALGIINYTDALQRQRRPVGSRRNKAEKVAGIMLEATANAVYLELLQRPVLWKDESDLLESLASRLGKPVDFYHLKLEVDARWKAGRYDGD